VAAPGSRAQGEPSPLVSTPPTEPVPGALSTQGYVYDDKLGYGFDYPGGWEFHVEEGDFPEPLKFILGQDIQPTQLYDNVEHTIIIVPCEGGQEASHIKEDDTLSQIFPDAERDLPKNVFSPIGIKGLEFKGR